MLWLGGSKDVQQLHKLWAYFSGGNQPLLLPQILNSYSLPQLYFNSWLLLRDDISIPLKREFVQENIGLLSREEKSNALRSIFETRRHVGTQLKQQGGGFGGFLTNNLLIST